MSVDATGQSHAGRYFTWPRIPVPDLRGADALDAVDAVVGAAVRRQMVSDVPVGVLLSGGIDSPLVAAKMRQATSGPITAFTIATDNKALDESADAKRYAQALGIRHVIRKIEASDALLLIDDVVSAATEPSDDYSIFPTALISRVAREHVTVVLSGDGGDDLMWGYPECPTAP